MTCDPVLNRELTYQGEEVDVAEYEWFTVRFISRSATGKTAMYWVVSKRDVFLGAIRWHAPWRQYAFYPSDKTIFNQTCLDDIQEFLAIVRLMDNPEPDPPCTGSGFSHGPHGDCPGYGTDRT